jgi:4-hydroxy-tetrahydrodipicolinate reductase
MNIALIGYGKLGKAIEEAALQKGHSIGLVITSQNKNALHATNLQGIDVAIECTNPESAVENILTCLQHQIPVACGSTGWLQHLSKVEEICKQLNGCFLYASNFSIGVNLFFTINKYVASLMAKQAYGIGIKEIHHSQKKDAPSGTAITIAQQILEQNSKFTTWVNATTHQINELPIVSERIDPAPGTHIVNYSSEIDSIELIHTAHNRKGFAHGAVLAAEFIVNKKGVFTMTDVLGL